ncbi:hypothetical protein BFW01_g500 [Lasiodiplodia theobromae]|nr:hypothetical protein BFW01_g500 [Lasiodiplodia theobromae]
MLSDNDGKKSSTSDRAADFAEGQVEDQSRPSHEVLHRIYNIWTASAYQVLMMASWTCNIVLYSTVTDLGGPMMLIYSTIFVTIGQCLMMSSLAEMCAVWPYAGGQQAFTKTLAPPSTRRFLSYAIGWVIFFGEIATSAGCAMNNAQIIGSLIQLSHPEFELTRYRTWLLYIATLIPAGFFSLSQKHLPWIAVVGGFITFGGGIAWAATFLALSPKQTASFVFTQFMNQSGYTSTGWVVIMSFYTPVYALYGTDGILHIAEEIKDAPKTAPRAMVWSMIFSGLTSFLCAIVMSFCYGNWEVYMQSDLPFVSWFIDTLRGVTGGTAFLVAIIVLPNFLIVIGINTASSRLVWSMARDNALPLSKWFAKINQTLQTPLNAILLFISLEIVIGVIVFVSDYAFQVIVSFGGVAMQMSYLIPVLLLLWRDRSALPLQRAFTLGRFGLGINIAAACWSSLIIVMLL